MITVVSNSEKDTKQLGKALGRNLHGGEILALRGNLGSGKTTFIKGLARGLGIRKIRSPSFAILRQFYIKSGKKFYHLDLWRLKGSSELDELGFREIIQDKDNIIAIEWGNKIRLPQTTIKIQLKKGKKPNQRIITLWGKGK